MEIATPNHPEWNQMKFPHRLFHLLNFMEHEGLSHMAHWDEQGVCFRIRKSEELVNKVLPLFFQQRKWKSLQRQMNIYSFKRISSGVNKGYYFHPFFQRSDISLAHQILRKKQKSELTASAWLALKEVSVGGVPRSCFISSMNDGVGLLPTSTKNENKIQLGLDQFSAQPTMRASIFDHALLSSETRVEDEESFGADFTMRNVDMKQEDIKHISFLFSRAGDRQSSLFNPNDIEAGGDLALVTLPHSHCGMSTLCHAAKFENDEWGDVINKLLRDVERSRTMMTATVLILLMTCQI